MDFRGEIANFLGFYRFATPRQLWAAFAQEWVGQGGNSPRGEGQADWGAIEFWVFGLPGWRKRSSIPLRNLPDGGIAELEIFYTGPEKE